MALQIIGKVMGRHSTGVDVAFYVGLVEKVLQLVQVEGRLELQIRPVHVPRDSRREGVYPVAYNVHAPNSVEVLLFNGTPSGRPGTLVAFDVTRMAAILEALSPRLFHSWQQAERRNHGVDASYVQTNPDKLSRRGLQRENAGDILRAMVSSARSWIKSQEGPVAHELLRLEREHKRLTVDMISGMFRPEPLEPLLHLPFLHVLESFGLIQLNEGRAAQFGLLPAIKTTDYCRELARLRREEENLKRQAEWRQRRTQLYQEVERARGRVRDLQERLHQATLDLAEAEGKLNEYNTTQPELIATIE